MVDKKKRDNWFQRYYDRKLKAYEALSWPQAFQSVAMAALFLVFVMMIFSLLTSTMPIDVECEFDDWREVPDNVSMIKDSVVMFPDYSRCHLSVELSSFDVGGIIAGVWLVD